MTRKSPHHYYVTTVLVALTTAVLLLLGASASAAIVPTVPIGTLVDYVVLGASTVTNTGPSVLNGSLGLSPGTEVTGFPPGVVNAPGTIHIADGPAIQAQIDLTNAHVDAAGREVNATVGPDLGGLTLVGGVYAAPSHDALSLTGTLTLDGANDPNSVWIFQTNSSLTTASASYITLINGARECNVFWQVGSSATLGTNSVFVGTILASTSVTVTTGTLVRGRALAGTGAVTLDTNVFTLPSCAAQSVPDSGSTTSTSTSLPVSTTTSAAGLTTTTALGTTASGVTATTTGPGGASGAPTTAPLTRLPFTGATGGPAILFSVASFALGGILLIRSRTEGRRP